MPVDTTEIKEWFTKRLPEDWYAFDKGELQVLADREEVVVIGPLAVPEFEEGSDSDVVESERRKVIREWRENTRERRMEIAEEAQERFGRPVSWGASVGSDRFLFTHVSVPAMTRLRITERQVLDTLVDAGVAASRSEALAWCVRYAGKKEEDWLNDLKKAFESVAEVRSKGPAA
jgi:hypothetical protein